MLHRKDGQLSSNRGSSEPQEFVSASLVPRDCRSLYGSGAEAKAWERFAQTGDITDYLHYKRVSQN